MRRRFAILVALAQVLPVPVLAQTASSGADLATGIRQVDEGDFEAAVITLDTVVQRLTPSAQRKEADLALAHLYLGMAHLGLSQLERAKSEMREAWRNNRKMKLDPMKFPPRVMQLYDEAKAEAQKAESALKPVPSPSPSPTAAASAAGSEKKKGGGGLKKALIVVGGLGVAGGIAIAAKGGGESFPYLAGVWELFLNGSNFINEQITFQQNGGSLTATVASNGAQLASGTGSVTASRAFTLHTVSNLGGLCDYDGTVDSVGSTISGNRTCNNVSTFSFELQLQRR